MVSYLFGLCLLQGFHGAEVTTRIHLIHRTLVMSQAKLYVDLVVFETGFVCLPGAWQAWQLFFLQFACFVVGCLGAFCWCLWFFPSEVMHLSPEFACLDDLNNSFGLSKVTLLLRGIA